MGTKNEQGYYNALLISLHWIMLVLLIAVVAFMEFRDIFPKGSAGRQTMKATHYSLGLLVLGLTLLRLGVRFSSAAPAIEPVPPRWQRPLAWLVQAGLYALLLAMPLAGWTALNAGDEAAIFFGWTLPAIVSPDPALAEFMEEAHETGATIAYVLLGLHVAGALYHHYVLRDNTLRRIWPRRKP